MHSNGLRQKNLSPNDLFNLAEQINHFRRGCCAAVGSALSFAISAGELLLQAKQPSVHGEWREWLVANFIGSAHTSWGDMRLAKHPDRIDSKMAEGSPVLSIDGALRLIARPQAKLWPAFNPNLRVERFIGGFLKKLEAAR